MIWLSILFGSFGLTARPNAMVATMTVLCALSIAIAVFVILDMDEPYGGLFGVPSTAMRNALADMMRPTADAGASVWLRRMPKQESG